jgi:hypothetical protein
MQPDGRPEREVSVGRPSNGSLGAPTWQAVPSSAGRTRKAGAPPQLLHVAHSLDSVGITDAISPAQIAAAPPGQAVIALQNSECPKEFFQRI